MRAKFNRKCNVYSGPASEFGPPNVLLFEEVPCRLVPQEQIAQLQFPLNLSEYWLTVQDERLAGPKITVPWEGAVLTELLASDQVTVTGKAGERWCVCREEYIDARDQPPYYRYLLIPTSSLISPPWPPRESLPPPPPIGPPPPPPPGSSCNDAAVLDYGQDVEIETLGQPGRVRWYRIAIPQGYHHVLANLDPFVGDLNLQHATAQACSGVSLIPWNTNCTTLFASSLGWWYLRVEELTTNQHTIVLHVSEGMC